MICRLCSKQSDQILHFFESEGLKMEIARIVAKHFWFEPKPEDNTSHIICNSCWITTNNFHELYVLVEKVEKDWTTNLASIKEDPCNDLVQMKVPDECFDDEKKMQHFETDNTIEEKTSNIKEVVINSEDQDLKSQKNEDNESENFNDFDNDIETEDEEIIPTVKKRGRPSKSSLSLRKSMRNLIKNENKIESKTNLKEAKKKKIKKERMQKRSEEETAAFNKRVAEGDALIASFMKLYCNICSVEQPNFTKLKHHCTSVHRQPGIVMCCQKKFNRKSKLVEHIEKHIDPKKHTCHICNHVSANRWNLKMHMNSLHKEEGQIKPFSCSYCSKTFKVQAQLIRHELIHLPEEERKFKCSYCDKNFPSDSSLKYHIRLCHEGYYSGVCDICGKAYNNRQDLKRHRLQVHEGVERSTYKCKYCRKEFKSKYTYNIHKFREHENKNPNLEYKCPMCNKMSPNSEALKNHIQYVHKAKAKFECNLCDKVFKRELALKEHMAAHIGQSLYSCPHCPKTFTHSSNMHHHRKLKHPVEFEIARKIKDDKKETWREFTSLNV